jgi:thiamine-monophosphate kinase
MKLSQLGEFGLIDRIRRASPGGRGVRLGIGDDAAWLQNRSSSCLVTADMLLESIHFDLRWTSLYDLGHKSLAVNISDIAAMGGVPAYAVICLGIPATLAVEAIHEFYRGFNALARKTGIAIVGGDTSLAGSLIISVCLIGDAPYKPVSRGGAKPNCDIYVTGTVGDAALGLKLLKTGSADLQDPRAAYLVRRHHHPTPRTKLGLLLARRQLASAMIDVSDGLLQDLGHICEASGVAAVVWQDAVPRSGRYRAFAEDSRLALFGGEDYELLFCAPRAVRPAIQRLAKQVAVPITRIGICVSGTGSEPVTVLDENGNHIQVTTGGHDHFARDGGPES